MACDVRQFVAVALALIYLAQAQAQATNHFTSGLTFVLGLALLPRFAVCLCRDCEWTHRVHRTHSALPVPAMQFEMDHPQAGTSSDREGDERRPFLLLSRSYSKPACRICLTDDDTDEKNLLISPCKCIGTQSYVHFDCLAKW